MRLRCWGEDHSQCRHPLATFLLNSTSARCNIDTHKTSSVLFGSTPCRELIRPVFSDEWVRTKTKNLPRKIQLASAPEIFSNSWLHFVDRKTCIRRRIADFFEPTGERLRSPRDLTHFHFVGAASAFTGGTHVNAVARLSLSG